MLKKYGKRKYKFTKYAKNKIIIEKLDIVDKDTLGEDDNQELEYQLRMFGMDKKVIVYIVC